MYIFIYILIHLKLFTETSSLFNKLVFHTIKSLEQEDLVSLVTINKKKTIPQSGIGTAELMPHRACKLEISPIKTIYSVRDLEINFKLRFIPNAWYKACT